MVQAAEQNLKQVVASIQLDLTADQKFALNSAIHELTQAWYQKGRNEASSFNTGRGSLMDRPFFRR